MTQPSRVPVNPVFSEFVAESELAQEVENRSTPFVPEVDQVLFHQGDAPTGLYFVRKGEVTLTMHSSNVIVMRVTARAGSLIGLPAILDNRPYSLTATACADAEIRLLPAEDFHKLLDSRPELCLNVLKILSGEIRSMRQAFADFKS